MLLEFADLAVLLGTAVAGYLVIRLLAQPLVGRAAARTSSIWDDIANDRKVRNRSAWLAPLIILRVGLPLTQAPATDGIDRALSLSERVLEALIVMTLVLTINAVLSAADRLYMSLEGSEDRPIKGYVQFAKLFLWVVGILIVIARLADQPIGALLAGLGAVSAVLLLVFRDTLLSLSASVQLSNADLLRLGDWIEVPDQSANGIVEDVSLLTVKVRNFDSTVTTIPTYNLISNSFKNWRGMTESGSRRMKRSINLDANSVRHLSTEEVEDWAERTLIGEHVRKRHDEIQEWNSHPDRLRRRLTNIGVFRAYVEAYLRAHPRILNDQTLMVRQLDPMPNGVPIELYAFVDTVVWEQYESVQSDIFDHLMAVVSDFGLRVHQAPTGADVRALRG